MKLRALGTGSPFCRHPLVTASFLIQSENTHVVIGCGPSIPTKLEALGLSVDQIDMWVLLSTGLDQVGGLIEVASTHKRSSAPYLVAPQTVLSCVSDTYHKLTGEDLETHFELRSVLRVGLNEEHFSDSLSFIPNYPKKKGVPSYSAFFEKAQIFISGNTSVNEEFLHRYGVPSEIILHACTLKDGTKESPLPTISELQELPVYLQRKIWLYGYENSYLEYEDPVPMLFVPQGTWIFDSSRKDMHLDKERFIRENSRRYLGNQTQAERQAQV